MLIKCPNCNRDTFEDYKCQYCKYVLKPKTNNYEKEVYEFLKEDYINSRNKSITIKSGIKKYNKSLEEIKEIVDYIADEIYEIENFKSKEELETGNIVEPMYSNSKTLKNSVSSLVLLALSIISAICLIISATKYNNKNFTIILVSIFLVLLIMFTFSLKPKKIRQKNTFYYSFMQYFIHDMIYKILLLAILCYIPIHFKEIFFKDGNILFIWIWYFCLFLLLLYFLFKWAEYSTSSITIDFDKISFKFQKANRSLHGEQIERFYYLSWSNYVDYNIQNITNIVETFNSFIIYGNITKNQFYVTPGNIHKNYKPKEYKRIVIRKCFKHNKELIKNLKIKIKHQ